VVNMECRNLVLLETKGVPPSGLVACLTGERKLEKIFSWLGERGVTQCRNLGHTSRKEAMMGKKRGKKKKSKDRKMYFQHRKAPFTDQPSEKSSTRAQKGKLVDGNGGKDGSSGPFSSS